MGSTTRRIPRSALHMRRPPDGLAHDPSAVTTHAVVAVGRSGGGRVSRAWSHLFQEHRARILGCRRPEPVRAGG